MRTPRKGRPRSKKKKDPDPTDRSNEESDSEYHQDSQPKVTSYLLDMDLRTVKAHLRDVLRKFRATKKRK
jgi:hypothetical protein